MEAKWTSMIHHVQDIHHHETPAFPSCAHPQLEGEARDKEWLEPGKLTTLFVDLLVLIQYAIKLLQTFLQMIIENLHCLCVHVF